MSAQRPIALGVQGVLIRALLLVALCWALAPQAASHAPMGAPASEAQSIESVLRLALPPDTVAEAYGQAAEPADAPVHVDGPAPLIRALAQTLVAPGASAPSLWRGANQRIPRAPPAP